MTKAPDVFYWLPCAVVFVSTAHEERRDIMTATAMFVSEKEPLLMISVAKDHLTEQLINQSGKFTLVIAGEGQRRSWPCKSASPKARPQTNLKNFPSPTLSEQPGRCPGTGRGSRLDGSARSKAARISKATGCSSAG